MTDTPTPAGTPRSPMATGTPEQKARYDVVSMLASRGTAKLDSDSILDLAHYVITGDLPEEDS